MAALLTLAEVRQQVESDLVDPALQRLIDDADSAIVSRFGAHASSGNVIEWHPGYTFDLYPFRRVGAVVAISEFTGATELVLDPTDFELRDSGFSIRRLVGGVNSRGTFGERVRLTYVPINDDAQRKRITADLVKLANRYEGVKSENAGDYSATSADYQAERESILSELAPALDFA